MATVLGANSVTGGFGVDNSVRMDGASKLTRNFGSAGNRKKWTMSMWVKRSKISADQKLMGKYTSSSDRFALLFNGSDQLQIFWGNDGGNKQITTNRLFRDTSAFYNFTFIIDTGNSTAADRMQIWVNGVRETSFASTAYPTSGQDLPWNDSGVNEIGSYNNSNKFSGYLAEVVHQNDNAATPVDKFISFDEDTGICVPIDVSGLTLGTNGFYLDFEDSSALGNDASGSNNFTSAGLAAIDQTTDTCTNNFATLNPLYQQGNNTFSEGNCKVVLEAGDGTKGVASNIAVSSGKWYFEVKQGSSTNSVIQVREASDKEDDLSYYEGSYAGYQFNNGNQYITGNSSSAYGASYADGDIIMVALDMDNDRVYFGKNGSWNDGDGNADEANLNDYAPVNGVTDAIAAFGNANGSATATAEFNFGNPPYANSSSVSDGNGFGNFEFAVPSGYFAICTKNLAEHG